MGILEKVYLDIILEDNYSDEYWMKYDSYKGIDFYIRKDGHLSRRLAERYSSKGITASKIVQIMKRFIKEELKTNGVLHSSIADNSSISYTVSAKLTGVYISGRLKANKGIWRCYIATVLPSEDMHHNSSDYYKEIDA